MIALLAVAAFVQNMAFTWVSRSRNGGDVGYHAVAALCSNSIWFACQVLIISQVWRPLLDGDTMTVLLVGAVYTAATAAGSCVMMHVLLRTEKGKRRVGATKSPVKYLYREVKLPTAELMARVQLASSQGWTPMATTVHPTEVDTLVQIQRKEQIPS